MPADSTFAFEACAPLVVVNSFAKSIDDGLDLSDERYFRDAHMHKPVLKKLCEISYTHNFSLNDVIL